MPSVEPSRLVASRRLAGLTRAALGERLGVTGSLVGAWEDGSRDADAHAPGLAEALGVSAAFLSRPEMSVTEPAAVTFRRRADARRATRDRAAAALDVAYSDLLPLYRQVLGELPAPDLPDLKGLEPDAAARLLREMWGLGVAPIKSVVSLLEAKGVRVFTTSDPSPSLSAFTRWIEGEPLLFLNTSIRDGCRHRFNCAHELAHLVLHRDVDFDREDSRTIEREADGFASAFLLSGRFLEEAPPAFRPESYFALKSRWGASALAMVRRMRDGGRFTQWQYESATIWLSREGYRSNPEPNCGAMEESVLGERWVSRLGDRDLDPARYAEGKGFPLDLLYEFVPAVAGAMAALSYSRLFDEPYAVGSAERLLDAPVDTTLTFYED